MKAILDLSAVKLDAADGDLQHDWLLDLTAWASDIKVYIYLMRSPMVVDRPYFELNSVCKNLVISCGMCT